MIYTITLNPALDYIISVPDYHSGKVNRTKSEHYLAGGKGINVSIVLANLGIASTAMGFVGGFVGREIVSRLGKYNIALDFVELCDNSRINIKIKAETETEINAKGPHIDSNSLDELFLKLERAKSGDTVVLAGSAPSGIEPGTYAQIVKIAKNRGARTVVDASGALLLEVLPHQPFLIKPNIYELGEICARSLCSDSDIISAAQKLQQQGARNILVSLGGEGAILVTEDNQILKHSAPKGRVINTTGAGDSMVAGFLAGLDIKQNIHDAFLMGISAGSASAFSEYLATKEQIMYMYNQIKINAEE